MQRLPLPNLRKWRDFRIDSINEAFDTNPSEALDEIEDSVNLIIKNIKDARKRLKTGNLPDLKTKRNIISLSERIKDWATYL